MNTTWTLNENSQGELKVIVNGDSWATAQEKAFKKLAKKVEVKGFRKGQVPEAMAKKAVSPQGILMEAVDEVSGLAFQEGIKEHELHIIARPELGVDAIDETEVVLTFKITVKPEVTLGEYKGLEITKDEVNVNDEEVAEELTKLQTRFAELTVKEDGCVENGDTAVIDFEGFKDGVAFDGGKGENHPLEIGSGSFILGFEEQLIGMKTEETKDVELTFPENYGAEDLAGQAVVFKVTLHEIKAKSLPEINDELIKDAEVEGVETVDAYKEYVVKNMMDQKETDAERKFETEMLTQLTANSPVAIPEVMVIDEVNNMLREFEGRLSQQGFPIDQYFQMTGLNEETLRGQMTPEAQTKVHVRLVLDEIATVEGFEIADEAIETEYTKIAEQYGMELDKVKEAIEKDSISYDLRLQQAVEIVKSNIK